MKRLYNVLVSRPYQLISLCPLSRGFPNRSLQCFRVRTVARWKMLDRSAKSKSAWIVGYIIANDFDVKNKDGGVLVTTTFFCSITSWKSAMICQKEWIFLAQKERPFLFSAQHFQHLLSLSAASDAFFWLFSNFYWFLKERERVSVSLHRYQRVLFFSVPSVDF